MGRLKFTQNGIVEELSESQQETINKALYYAVRENYNARLDESKTEIMREALDIMKAQEEKPVTSHMCDLALDDFFKACQVREWTEELYKIPWLKVKGDKDGYYSN